MFIRQCYRRKNGKRHAYWALVESYRTPRGPRQRIVSYLGEMDTQGRLGIQQAATGQGKQYQHRLFDDVAPQWVEVDTSRIRIERCVDFGVPWLGLELLERLGITSLLKQLQPPGREEIEWSLMSLILVICRLCEPSSELHIAEHIYCHTAMGDLLGIALDKINDDRLYRALDQLLPHKEAMEVHLKNQLGTLFNLEYDILLYDVTSTYFEGQAKSNDLAQRGYSRDHRGDCKQVCITIAKRVGRLLGQNSRAAGLFETNIIKHTDGRAKLTWHKVEAWRNWATLSEGCYMLRTNINSWSGEELWKAYIQLTEAEAAFRIHKSDLKIRPVWHQKTERVQAHILVCFLAYVVWKTLGQMCKTAGLGDEPRRVFEELSRIKAVDVVLPIRSGGHIRRRCICQPTEHQAILLSRLGFRLPKNLPLDGKFLKAM